MACFPPWRAGGPVPVVGLYGSVVVGLTIPLAGKIVDAVGRRSFLVVVTVLIGVFLFFLAPLMGGSDAALYGFVPFGMFLMGLTYGVLGAALAAPFPTRVR